MYVQPEITHLHQAHHCAWLALS